MGLTPKREAFCQAYVETGNAAEAYRRCYSVARMSAKSVQQESWKLLQIPEISQRVTAIRQVVEDRSIMTAVEIQQKLSNIARAKLSDALSWDANGVNIIPSSELPPETLDAVASVKVKRRRVWIGSGHNAEPWEIEELEIKMHDPQQAKRELARLKGLHAPEKVEHSGPRGGPISLDVTTKPDFDHDGYSRLFGEHLALSQSGTAGPDGSEESVDPSDPDAEAGIVLGRPSP